MPLDASQVGDEIEESIPRGVPLNPWAQQIRDHARGRVPTEWRAMIAALAQLQEVVATTAPPATVTAEATAALRRAAELLAPHQTVDPDRYFGQLIGEVGRGQSFSPSLRTVRWTPDQVDFDTQLGWYYAGSGGAAHGGAISLLFDEAMGILVDLTAQTKSRTAYLNVDYRSITPVDHPLRLTARTARREGRKRFVTAQLYADDRLCAEADALFVALRPGQR
jgi:acyl-coenzyme A thioesterase PaaI-like protein